MSGMRCRKNVRYALSASTLYVSVSCFGSLLSDRLLEACVLILPLLNCDTVPQEDLG